MRRLRIVASGIGLSALVTMIVIGCSPNCHFCDEARKALGESSGHDPSLATLAPWAGQKTCPVSGKKLGETGQPIPVHVQNEVVYVCCPNCVEELKRDPAPYLAKVALEWNRLPPPPALPQDSSSAVSATLLADAALADPYDGQRTCPVMDMSLEPTGKARAVTVKGETIYVCCARCLRQVKRDPDKYLAKVHAERAETKAAQAAAKKKQAETAGASKQAKTPGDSESSAAPETP